jgi:hypothetical protein
MPAFGTMIEAFTVLFETKASSAFATRFGGRFRRWCSGVHLEFKSSRISFQNYLTGFVNIVAMQSGIVTCLALAFWATSCAGGEALTIEFQAF